MSRYVLVARARRVRVPSPSRRRGGERRVRSPESGQREAGSGRPEGRAVAVGPGSDFEPSDCPRPVTRVAAPAAPPASKARGRPGWTWLGAGALLGVSTIALTLAAR